MRLRMLVACMGVVGVTWATAAGEAAAAAPTPPQVTRHEAPGNLESTHDLPCLAADQLQRRYSPPDLFRASVRCAAGGSFDRGALLYWVAHVYGRFDMARVADKSAHEAMTVLQMQVAESLDGPTLEKLQQRVTALYKAPEEICAVVTRVGPPSYDPRYMVQHGLQAFLGGAENGGLRGDFEAAAAWRGVLDRYLHCPAKFLDATPGAAAPSTPE